MSNHNDNVYEVVVTHYDSETKTKTIVLGPKALLAKNEDAARMCAVREVPDSFDCNALEVQARVFK